jgi:hypothetical protein
MKCSATIPEQAEGLFTQPQPSWLVVVVTLQMVVVDGGVEIQIAIYHWFIPWTREEIKAIIILVGLGSQC